MRLAPKPASWFALAILASVALMPADPSAAAGSPLAIVMPGGSGVAKPGGFLLRNRTRLERAGFQVVVASTPAQAAEAARQAHARGRKVFLLAISLGVARAAAALEAGAPADAAVFFSGAYTTARSSLRSPDRLPPTLMVHHRKDGCPTTTPASAEAFRRWAGRKIARLVWVTSTGNTLRWVCGPRGAHGYFEKDLEPISAAIAFLKSR
ncbi:MAG: hypothetical protein VYD64_06365 [Pseudomonadota bacterium]|nr:hypothetical protein [Pseudomonadota bacterium]